MSGGWGGGWALWSRGGVCYNIITRKPGTRVPVLIPDGYPGRKIPESPSTKREPLLACTFRFSSYLHCVQKKTPTHNILSYPHELFVDLNKNCSEYIQGLIDSNNVEIRYSLRPMT